MFQLLFLDTMTIKEHLCIVRNLQVFIREKLFLKKKSMSCIPIIHYRQTERLTGKEIVPKNSNTKRQWNLVPL